MLKVVDEKPNRVAQPSALVAERREIANRDFGRINGASPKVRGSEDILAQSQGPGGGVFIDGDGHMPVNDFVPAPI